MTELTLTDFDDVFKFSKGDSVGDQPEDGWRGVAKINYKVGKVWLDTRYRFSWDEKYASAGFFKRLWMKVTK